MRFELNTFTIINKCHKHLKQFVKMLNDRFFAKDRKLRRYLPI